MAYRSHHNSHRLDSHRSLLLRGIHSDLCHHNPCPADRYQTRPRLYLCKFQWFHSPGLSCCWSPLGPYHCISPLQLRYTFLVISGVPYQFLKGPRRMFYSCRRNHCHNPPRFRNNLFLLKANHPLIPMKHRNHLGFCCRPSQTPGPDQQSNLHQADI